MRKALLAGVALIALAEVIPAASASPITFSYTGSIVDYTVPTTGTYQITAAGAQGGRGAHFSYPGQLGGLGAVISGEYLLAAGDELEISAGGRGGDAFGGEANVWGGGGGGSVAALVTGLSTGPVPLVVAGGGGGGNIGFCGPVCYGGGGLTTPGGGGGDGGTDGNGGGYDNYHYYDSYDHEYVGSYGGGGGGGYYSVGASATPDDFGDSPAQGGGLVLGGAGGHLGTDVENGGWGGNGGFGGGGGGGLRGGGGGGYSGGGDCSCGGGSYLDPLALDPVLTAAANLGDGYVTIDLISDPPDPVPEPGSLALFASGLIGVLALRRRKARTPGPPGAPIPPGASGSLRAPCAADVSRR